jgi:hypothetical protein
MTLRINQAALNGLVARSGITAQYGRQVRDEARVNASAISPSKAMAIDTENGLDAVGPYTDVGYRKDHGGFVLWWHEVGTRHLPARPHLRPAVRRRS